MNKRKQVLGALGIACIVFALFIVLVYAANSWNPNQMAKYMETVGQHQIDETNTNVNDIENAIGGQVIEGVWQTQGGGGGWHTSFSYTPPEGKPKTFSFWVNTADWGLSDVEVTFVVQYVMVYPYSSIIENTVNKVTLTHDDIGSYLIVDKMPIAKRISIYVGQSSGDPIIIPYQAIIEDQITSNKSKLLLPFFYSQQKTVKLKVINFPLSFLCNLTLFDVI